MTQQEYAIEFLFDEASENRIFELYDKLECSGFGLPEHIIDYHPHITLNVCHIEDLAKLEPVLKTFASNCVAFPLKLSHMGAFLTPQAVVFLGVTMTQQLTNVHKEFIQISEGFILPSRPYYQPDHWVPHCTLAFDFDLAHIGKILELCSSFTLPLQVQIESLALVEVPKGSKLFHYPLT